MRPRIWAIQHLRTLLATPAADAHVFAVLSVQQAQTLPTFLGVEREVAYPHLDRTLRLCILLATKMALRPTLLAPFILEPSYYCELHWWNNKVEALALKNWLQMAGVLV
jgi:hypothetical protein